MSSRLVFGSCSSQHYPEQPLWKVIQDRNATAFIWGGDAIYADDRFIYNQPFFPLRKRLTATPDYLRQLYDEQLQQPGYRALLDTNISVFGTIDDHDYGVDNGDGTFAFRKESGMEFVRFLGLPEDSPVYSRAMNGRGVYGVQVYDFSREKDQRLMSDVEAGLDPDVVPNWELSTHGYENDNRKVAVFVLDIRSNKSPWIESYVDHFGTNTRGDFLGDEQWSWFHTAIGRSTAAVNIIVSGIQYNSEKFFNSKSVESWRGFPRAQQQLYQTVLQPNVRTPILVSGDIHMAQLMRKDCIASQADPTSTQVSQVRPLYEVTTSGMTHSWGTRICARANDVFLCHVPVVNVLFRQLFELAYWISDWSDLIVDGTTRQLQYSLEMNVAEMEFDWDNERVLLNLLGTEGNALLHQVWSFQDLTRVDPSRTAVTKREFQTVSDKLQQYQLLPLAPRQEDSPEWVCVQHRGLGNGFRSSLGLLIPFALFQMCVWSPFIVGFLLYRNAGRKQWRKHKSQ
eukprot:Nitzschia sp. Nitz4//scaffold7_size249615//199035//200567//NITZ4_001202-RA/size249615-processed-gene-0.156-mRNA-1//1//CDS//3329558517//8721//frame0